MVNELELLGVVWAIQHFKYYLYGKHFTVITDHQDLISALNASERSKTSQSRLTRWIDRLISFHFDIKHLARNKMGLYDYLLNKAQYELIKKRAENKEVLNATSNAHSTYEHSKHSTHGQLQTKTSIQSHSKIAYEQSVLSQTRFHKAKPTIQKSVNCITHSKMSKRSDTRGFKGGCIPTELKSVDTGGKTQSQLRSGKDRQIEKRVCLTQDGTKGHLQKGRK